MSNNPELDAIQAAISAAKAANVASIRALETVERLLGFSNGFPNQPELATETTETSEGGCDHSEAVEAATVQGRYLICHCGFQQRLQ